MQQENTPQQHEQLGQESAQQGQQQQQQQLKENTAPPNYLDVRKKNEEKIGITEEEREMRNKHKSKHALRLENSHKIQRAKKRVMENPAFKKLSVSTTKNKKWRYIARDVFKESLEEKETDWSMRISSVQYFGCYCLPFTDGVGYMREEESRKSGVEMGRVNRFYISPAQKPDIIKTKPLLVRHLGNEIRRDFDYATGKWL